MVNACLLLLGFVVGVEFYFTALPGQMNISWLQAAQLGLRNWFPWLVLCPAVIAWAGVFGFERKAWPRSLLAHAAACVAVVLFYEALQTWLFPQPAAGIFGAPLPPPPGFNSPLVAERANADSSRPARSASTGVPSPPALGMNPLRPSMLQRAAFKTQFTIPIYWCIVCVCWGLNHLQESRERERRALGLEARLAEANLRVLKMQLQPHFLFNALHAIASLIHENPKAADDMIGALSQFLRMNLEASAENEVALERELEFVDRYLQIQQARFGDRLRFQREIEPAARDALVPPFILQPLVENSIRHGIEARESGGTVLLRALRSADKLHLEVSDDGGGFRDGELLNRTEGIGLSNTKARLQALYGEQHELRLTQNHPKGACVTLEIPFRGRHSKP